MTGAVIAFLQIVFSGALDVFHVLSLSPLRKKKEVFRDIIHTKKYNIIGVNQPMKGITTERFALVE